MKMSPLNSCCTSRMSWVALVMMLSILLLGGCGGGVDSGGTGAPATAAVAASGPITGFGSVIVNGVRFDENSASISDSEGNVRSRDDLKLGMTTSIKGSAVTTNANVATSTATSIVFGSAILGPITSTDADAQTLVVLGQTIDVTATTVFDNDLSGGLEALSVDDVVEVYALFDGLDKHYSATRIERKASASVYRLRGPVSDLDTAEKEFDIGNERISYAGVPANEIPATLANGRFVRVQLQTTQSSGGEWIATRLQDGVSQLEDRDEARIEGLISAFVSSTVFSVDGVSVDASRANVTGVALLGLGIRVEVSGTSSNGVLLADEVKTKTETEVEDEGFELEGTIITIDTGSETFVLRGVTVDYSAPPIFESGTVADLGAGKRVEVKGTLSADGTGLRATEIEFKP